MTKAKKDPKKLTRFTLELDKEILDALDIEAVKNDRSRTGQVRRILRERYGLTSESENEN